MGLLDRVAAARGRKSWAGEPPFWQSDALRASWVPAATATREPIGNDFEGYVAGAYKGNGVLFGAIDRRQQVFSQGRFQWRRFTNGVPGDFFGSPELGLLEQPWPNGTTGELLAHMEYDATLAGQFYCTTVDDNGPVVNGVRQSRIGRAATGPGRRIVRMRPDWTTLVIDAPSGNPYGVDARVVAYSYQPPVSGYGSSDPLLLLPGEVVHYSPKPDPVARFRGMSWLTPILQDIQADNSATTHKRSFFDNGAVPGLVIKGIQAASPQQFNQLVDMMEERHAGAGNAFRTLYLSAGADAAVIGTDLKQLDFQSVQSGGETRIAVAAGVPAPILGIFAGLSGSSLNAGNFGAARRLFVDTTIQDLWAKAAASLAVLLTSPGPGAELAVDGRWIPFLREDAKDRADIQNVEAQTIRNLVDAGYTADSITAAMAGRDWKLLVHSGLFSVQLQAPTFAMPALGSSNGSTLNGSANGHQAVSAR